MTRVSAGSTAPRARRSAWTTCRTACSRPPSDDAPGGRRGSATTCSTWRRSPPAEMLEDRHAVRGADAEPVPGAGPPGLDVRCATGCIELLTDDERARPRRAAPGPARRGHAAPAVRGGRLRRLLLLRAPRHQRRPDLPPDGEPLTPTGSTCRSATTAGPARSWSPAPTCVRPERPAQAARRRRARPTARAGGSTSRPRSASSSARRRALGDRRCRRRRSPTTCSACACSTTGRRATSRPGSTCRSGRSSASRSPPRSRAWVAPLDALEAARVALPGAGPGAAGLPARSTSLAGSTSTRGAC